MWPHISQDHVWYLLFLGNYDFSEYSYWYHGEKKRNRFTKKKKSRNCISYKKYFTDYYYTLLSNVQTEDIPVSKEWERLQQSSRKQFMIVKYYIASQRIQCTSRFHNHVSYFCIDTLIIYGLVSIFSV